MKKLDLTAVLDTAKMPLKKGTLQFMQDSHIETVKQALIGAIGSSYDTAKVYIVNGLLNSIAGFGGGTWSYDISSGAVLFGGEIYLTGAVFGSTTASHDLYFVPTITSYTTDADPVQLSDGLSPVNIHNIKTMVLTNELVAGNTHVKYHDAERIAYGTVCNNIQFVASDYFNSNIEQLVPGDTIFANVAGVANGQVDVWYRGNVILHIESFSTGDPGNDLLITFVHRNPANGDYYWIVEAIGTGSIETGLASRRGARINEFTGLNIIMSDEYNYDFS